MAGIEQCLKIVKEQGKTKFTEMLQMRSRLIDRTSQLRNLEINQNTDDPCKIIIFVKKPLTGNKLYQILHDQYHLEMEMATDNYIVAIITLMDTQEGYNRLADALIEIDGKFPPTPEPPNCQTPVGTRIARPPEIIKPIHEAYDTKRLTIPINAANGTTSAEFVALYPPGRPIIVPGEKIDNHIIEMISGYIKNGLKITGLAGKGDAFWISR